MGYLFIVWGGVYWPWCVDCVDLPSDLVSCQWTLHQRSLLSPRVTSPDTGACTRCSSVLSSCTWGRASCAPTPTAVWWRCTRRTEATPDVLSTTLDSCWRSCRNHISGNMNQCRISRWSIHIHSYSWAYSYSWDGDRTEKEVNVNHSHSFIFVY